MTDYEKIKKLIAQLNEAADERPQEEDLAKRKLERARRRFQEEMDRLVRRDIEEQLERHLQIQYERMCRERAEKGLNV